MARKTAAERKAIQRAAIDAADKALALTPQDAHNILVLLDRVPTKGHTEATLLAILAQKLKQIKGAFKGEPSGEDITGTD